MSTHNICFHVELRKMSALFCWKKYNLWSYMLICDVWQYSAIFESLPDAMKVK